MAQTSNVTEQIEAVRQHTIAFLDELIQRTDEFELPVPPPALERYRQKLRQNAYKVLVVGEAKRGKSTFVNALIGRDILPTDVDVATSQVFNICPSQHEAYRLRFEDGSEREISLQDLPLYGSQVMADAGVVPTSDKVIRWIEIDVPIRFLPKNVSILDTPGLGALYAGHAQLTHRFVPEADAVIFVLESGQPVVNEDLKFIEEILTVTTNIFFIQTKIDQYSKADWQDIQRRNQEILKERFNGRLTDTRVWPVSSTNLSKAASVDKRTEEAYLMVSRHKELASALQAFLARVAGWSRAAEAMQAAALYHATTRKTLAGRLATLTAESKQKQTELQKVAYERRQRFDAEWGVQGQKYQKLRESLKQAITVGKQSFSSALQPGSDIELAQKAKIDAVSSLDEANQVRESMPGEVITAALNSWTRVCKEVQHRCIEHLGPFAEAADEIGAPLDPKLSGLAVTGAGLDNEFKTDYFAMFRVAAGGGMLILGTGSIVGYVLPTVVATALTPVAPYVAIPALVALVGTGLKAGISGQLKSVKQELRTQLMSVLQQVRRHFFDVDLAAGSFSRVDEYFRTLERTVNEQVQEMVKKKSEESQAEITLLTQKMQLDGREREAQTKQIQEQLTGWDDIGESGRAVMSRIKALESSQAPNAARTIGG